MIWIGPTSSIFDITTFALMWYVFSANSVEMQTLFQSGWFIEGLLSQTLVVHMLRTRKIPFFAAMDQYLHRAQAVVSVQHLAGLFGVGVMTTCTDQDAHIRILVMHGDGRATATV